MSTWVTPNVWRKKLKKQKEKDPQLFVRAVRQWLIVMRGEVGDESGLSSKSGLSLPQMTKFYEDEDRTIPARQHITALVGYLPRPHETDDKFLARVEKAAKASVSAHIIKKSDSDSDSSSSKSKH